VERISSPPFFSFASSLQVSFASVEKAEGINPPHRGNFHKPVSNKQRQSRPPPQNLQKINPFNTQVVPIQIFDPPTVLPLLGVSASLSRDFCTPPTPLFRLRAPFTRAQPPQRFRLFSFFTPTRTRRTLIHFLLCASLSPVPFFFFSLKMSRNCWSAPARGHFP